MANPNKPKPILDILLRNQEKLIDFLTKFHTDRSEDEQFNDEKAYLIKQIKELKPLASSSVGGSSNSGATTPTTPPGPSISGGNSIPTEGYMKSSDGSSTRTEGYTTFK